MRHRSVIPIEARKPDRRTAALNTLAQKLRDDGESEYLIDVVVALREAAEEADDRLSRIERGMGDRRER